MFRALYTAATGMEAQKTLVDVTANNIANVNTNGFKRSQVDFADLIYVAERQAGAEAAVGQPTPTGLEVGSGVRPVGTTKHFRPGTLEQTGNTLDVAIERDGFIKVQLPNGEARYTRDGAMRLDATGRFVTGDGLLLDSNITVPDGIIPSSITIGRDGTVSGVQTGAGNTTTTLGQILLSRFPNPAGLSSEGGNLYAQSPASGAEVQDVPGNNGLGTLRQSFLEKSNVEVVTELVALINAQRAYEVNSRAIRAADEMLSVSKELVR
jgi:flagellar basal-body rod protein FlgG